MPPNRTVIGVDLGGTKTSIVRFRENTWTVEEEVQVPTPAKEGLEACLAEIHSQIVILRDSSTRAVGVGVAGLVRQPEGSLIRAPNIERSENFPVREYLERATKLPVSVDNDAHCFALAEARVGAGRGRDVVIGVTMGTGVGGGIVIDGVLFRGEHGFAGEFGHMLLRPGQPPIPAEDKRGEVEQFFSGTAMGKRCAAAERPGDYLEGEVCAFLRPDVFREVAWMCVNLTYAFDPSIIVFGGSAGRALKMHLPTVGTEFRAWLLPGTPTPELAVGELDHAGALGAALLTVERPPS